MHPNPCCVQVEQVPMETHAQYRFLLNTDGQAASWRFAKLLAIDSVILKWRSGNIEYYYRSVFLFPCRSVLCFW